MQLLIKTLQGVEFMVIVKPDESIHTLKLVIATQKLDWQAAQLELVCAHRHLDQDDLPIESYGIQDQATIHVIFNGGQIPPSAVKSIAKPGGKACLVHSQESLLRHPQFSDLTVTCGGRTWKCHRSILAQRCTFFKAACGGSWSEAQTQPIDFPDDDPNGMDMLLVYLYTLETPKLSDGTKYGSLASAQLALKLGDKYDLPVLRDAGQESVLDAVLNLCLIPAKVLDIVTDSLFDWIGHVWDSEVIGTTKIREAILEVLVWKLNNIANDRYFQLLFRKNGDFAVAFFQALAKRDNPKDDNIANTICIEAGVEISGEDAK